MILKDDLEKTKKKLAQAREEEEKHSLAWDILQEMKVRNNRLFICNILLVITLIIFIIVR